MKKILSLALAAVIAFSIVTPAFAADTGAKEEVIYGILDFDGVAENIYVVNIWNGGDITDYGDYSEIRNMTTTDVINRDGERLTVSTVADKLYYQGAAQSNELPWNIAISYNLDGKDIAGADLAGQSGKLEIRFKVSENVNCKGSFFDDYALQATFVLNTERCKNISASGATEANVGKNKQLNFTIMPGFGIDTSITADVTDFEMDAVAINGVKMNLNLDFDYSELTVKTDDLTDGIAKLDDGANELKNGADEFKDGVSTLNNGISELKDGIKTAQDGLNTLNAKSGELISGSAEVKAALATISSSLAGVSASADNLETLVSASGAIKTGIADLYKGAGTLNSSLGYSQYKAVMGQNGLDIDKILAENPQIAPLIYGTESYLNGLSDGSGELYSGLGALKSKYDEFDKGIAELAKALGGTMTNLSKLADGINELAANYAKLDGGIAEYTSGVSRLAEGYAQITDGIRALANGSEELTTAARELYDGTVELADGTAELRDKTSDMDSQINEKIDEMLGSAGGGNSETVSFVSDKNTNVKSVQFVLQTKAIKLPEVIAPVAETPVQLNFWQKLLKLFGLYHE
jgi:putative membrane protein